MRYMVERNFVQVIGTIWMPAITCAMEYPLTKYDIDNIGEFTRENVEEWLTSHSGDFQCVKDFRATVGDDWIDWQNDDSENVYFDCVHGCEE